MSFLQKGLTARGFSCLLEQRKVGKQIFHVLTVDFPDPDNLATLLALLSTLKKTYSAQLHVIFVQHPFSAENAPAYVNPATGLTVVEGVADEVDGRTFVQKYLKESFGMKRDKVDERMLLEVNAARFRAILYDSGFTDQDFVFYDGGVASLSGVSPAAHKREEAFVVDADKDILAPSTLQGPLRVVKADEYREYCRHYASLAPEARRAYFQQRYDAIPAGLRAVEPLERLAETVRALPEDVSAVLYSGAPLTGIVRLPADVRDRFVFGTVMGGSLDDGKLNILGAPYNNLADAEASAKFVDPATFKNMRVVFQPTNTFKEAPKVCTIPYRAIESIGPDCKVLQWTAQLVELWTALDPRGETQPLFDVATLFTLLDLVEHWKVFPVSVVTGPNKYAVDTPMANTGFQLVPRLLETKERQEEKERQEQAKEDDDAPNKKAKTVVERKWLDADDVFPVGLYSTDAYGIDGTAGANFSESAAALLPNLLHALL